MKAAGRRAAKIGGGVLGQRRHVMRVMHWRRERERKKEKNEEKKEKKNNRSTI